MIMKRILSASLMVVLLVAPATAHDNKNDRSTLPESILFPGDILFPSDASPDVLALRAAVITHTRQLNELAGVILFDVKRDGSSGVIVFDRDAGLFDNLVGFYEITNDLAKAYSEINSQQAEQLHVSAQTIRQLSRQEIDPQNDQSIINFMQNLDAVTVDVLALISH